MIYLTLFLSSLLSTYMVREFFKKRALLDHPNSRSSHTIPTPTAGGAAFVVIFYLFLILFHKELESRLVLALLCGIPLAIVSLIDDFKNLSFKLRFLVQALTVFGAIYFLGTAKEYALLLVLFLFLASLWLINLYNFLDGIDGYAASEAIFVSVGAYLIYGDQLFLYLAILVSGFLVFNWHKASIFMGDVGSTFLGFFFAVEAIYRFEGLRDIVIWYLLLGVFIFDATYTLLKRLTNGENITAPHKKHLFQRAVVGGLSHSEVTIFLIFFNMITFIPLYLSKDSTMLYLWFFVYNLLLILVLKRVDRMKSFD